VRTRADFGALLEALRRGADLSIRAAARRSGNPSSTLQDWFTGDRLPARGQDGRFRALLDVLGAPDPERVVAALDRLRDADSRRRPSRAQPFPGLAGFGPGDAAWFFGRAGLVDAALARFHAVVDRPGRRRLLWVVGASGSGKSSLLHAGLWPALEAEGRRVASLTPGDDPLGRLAGGLATVLGVEAAAVHAALEWPDGRGLHDIGLGAGLAPAGAPGPAGPVLIVDQCEEALRGGRDAQERFAAGLCALTDPGSPVGCAVVAGLRIEMYACIAAHPGLAGSLQESQVLVGPMRTDEVREAVVGPARTAGFAVQDELVAVLLRDLVPPGSLGGTHDPGALPLLAHALRETWNRSRRREMSVESYEAAGGIRGAIEASAQRVYAALDEREQELARQVLLRLVHVEDGGLATRRVATAAELGGLAPPGSAERRAIGAIVERFVDARLLTAQATTVEITHESLLTAWPRLTGWIEDSRDDLRLHRRLVDAARAWTEAGADPELLVGGLRLDAMRGWARSAGHRVRLNQQEHDFLAASQNRAVAVGRARRRRAFRLRTLSAISAALAVLSMALAVLLNRARTEAIVARDEARSREAALTALLLRATDPGLASQLAVAAYAIEPTVEARSAVLASAGGPVSARRVGGPGPAALAATPDGALTAVSDASNGTVRLHARRAGRRARAASLGSRAGRPAGVIDLGGPDHEVHALAFTPDGRTLVTGDSDAEVRLWDVTDPHRPRARGDPLRGPDGAVRRLAVSPDGTELAAAGEGPGTFRWDITDPAAPRPRALLPAPAPATVAVAYDPRAARLAVGDGLGNVQLWDVPGARTGSSGSARPGPVLPVDGRPVRGLAFDPGGRYLAAGTEGGRLRVWDLAGPTGPRKVPVAAATADSWVNTTAFSPDGRFLLAGSSDLRLRVWSTATWAPVAVLPHPAAVTGAAVLADGVTVVSAAADGGVRWWDLPAALALRVRGRVWSLTFDRAGDRMATTSADEVVVWDLAAGPAGPADPARSARREVALTPPGADPPMAGSAAGPADPPPPDGVPGIDDGLGGTSALAPGGDLLALGGRRDGDVYLVDLAVPADPALAADLLPGRPGLVRQVAFRPDGGALAAGGDDTDVRLWSLSDRRPGPPVGRVAAPTEPVLGLAWSPDGRLLAVPSADSRVYLVDVSDLAHPEVRARLDAFAAPAHAAAFSPDGTVLATGGSEGFVVLWDVSDPRRPRRIGEPVTGPGARIMDLAFDPGGRNLAAAVTDGRTWLWDVGRPAAPEARAVLGPHGGQYQVEFHPATGDLVSSGADGTVRWWPTDVDAVVATICRDAGDPLTAAEWATQLPGSRFVAPCSPDQGRRPFSQGDRGPKTAVTLADAPAATAGRVRSGRERPAGAPAGGRRRTRRGRHDLVPDKSLPLARRERCASPARTAVPDLGKRVPSGTEPLHPPVPRAGTVRHRPGSGGALTHCRPSCRSSRDDAHHRGGGCGYRPRSPARDEP
jgi:WD40 repeat protein